jgi:hypothetical protein
VLAVIFPVAASVPVTVTVYAPAVVPGIVVVFVPPPPPHPTAPAITISATTLSAARHARRRPGIPRKKTRARVAPPPRKNLFSGDASELVEVLDAVVATVTVAVAAVVPLMVTEDGMLQVGGSLGLLMEVVTAQVRFTAPVNPPPGVTVTVDVLPVVAPAATVMAPLLLIVRVPDELPEGPVTVTGAEEDVV